MEVKELIQSNVRRRQRKEHIEHAVGMLFLLAAAAGVVAKLFGLFFG